MLNTRLACGALALGLLLAACGGGSKGSTSNTNAAAPMSSPGAGGAYRSATGEAAPVPATVHCGAVAPVWVNTRTHVYHTQSDPLYGRTKRGEYMCPSEAAKEGYHAAGGGSMKHATHHRRRGGTNTMQAQPSPSP